MGGRGGGEGGGAGGGWVVGWVERSERSLSFRAIWNVILLVWKRRSPILFHSAGKEKSGIFLRDSKLIMGRKY